MITRRAVDALLMSLAVLPSVASEAAAGSPSVTLPEPKRFHLFLLAGQSNMAGRGDVEAADKEPIVNVLALDARGAWVHATDPVHWDKPSAGVGLARAFAIEYSRTHPGITVGLVPAACGGSPIASWAPGQYFEDTKSHPYDDAIARAKGAMTVGTLRGILWHQGESDRSPALAPRYEQALRTLIARFREDLHAPDVPFLVGQLGQFLGGGQWDEWTRQVDRAQQDVAQTVPVCAFVLSHGLSSKPDNLHFDARSLREFGKRYAVALASLTSVDTGSATKSK
jgi:hypothetical protein